MSRDSPINIFDKNKERNNFMNIKVKSLISIILWIAYFIFRKVFYPITSNTQTLKQFDNTTQSFTDYAFYQQVCNWLGLILIIICVVLFFKELKILYYKIRRTSK